jgi:hypothetical protein
MVTHIAEGCGCSRARLEPLIGGCRRFSLANPLTLHGGDFATERGQLPITGQAGETTAAES